MNWSFWICVKNNVFFKNKPHFSKMKKSIKYFNTYLSGLPFKSKIKLGL